MVIKGYGTQNLGRQSIFSASNSLDSIQRSGNSGLFTWMKKMRYERSVIREPANVYPVSIVRQIVVRDDKLNIIPVSVNKCTYALIDTSAHSFVIRIRAEVLARSVQHEHLRQ